MTQTASQPDGMDTMLNTFIATTRSSREDMLQAWSRSCDLYARYFAGLGKAHGPEDVMAAHADFVLSATEELTHGLTHHPRTDGAAHPKS